MIFVPFELFALFPFAIVVCSLSKWHIKSISLLKTNCLVASSVISMFPFSTFEFFLYFGGNLFAVRLLSSSVFELFSFYALFSISFSECLDLTNTTIVF